MDVKAVSVACKKAIIVDFLNKCNLYSEQKVLDYERRMSQAEKLEQLSLVQKKHDWQTYQDFNTHAINELKGDELDDWL